MGCPVFIAKYLLYCVNFVVTLLSLIIIGLGALVLYFGSSTGGSIPAIAYIPIIIIVAGSLLFLISTCGCCGSIGESTCFLIMYAIFMALLFGGTIFLSVLLRGNMDAAEKTVEQQLENTFDNSNTRVTFFVVEGLLKCCGTTGPDSYLDRNLTISVTCCPNPSLGNVTVDNVADLENINEVQLCEKEDSYSGCTPAILKLVSSFTDVIYYFLIAIIVITLTGVLSALYLAYQFRTKKQKPDDVMVYPHPYPHYRY